MRDEIKLWLRALVIVIVGVPLWSLASNLTTPNSFAPNTTIQSAQVNANFAAVQTAVNSKQDAVTSACPAGQAVTGIAAVGGALTCAADGLAFGSNVTGSTQGYGLLVTDTATGVAIEGNNTSTPLAGVPIYGVGVLGAAPSGTGVEGTSTNGAGVEGISVGGPGLSGSSATGPGILASNSSFLPTGVALSIQRGYLQVVGAGANTATTAFIWTATAASIVNNYTAIQNQMADPTNPNLILMVTQNFEPNQVFDPDPVGVMYVGGTGWTVFNEDGVAMPVGASFNVLVISP